MSEEMKVSLLANDGAAKEATTSSTLDVESSGVAPSGDGDSKANMDAARQKYYVPEDESTGGESWFAFLDLGFSSSAGKTGTYCGFALLVLTMIASVITQYEGPDSVSMKEAWLEGCPIGFHDSCIANQSVLRYVFIYIYIYIYIYSVSHIH